MTLRCLKPVYQHHSYAWHNSYYRVSATAVPKMIHYRNNIWSGMDLLCKRPPSHFATPSSIDRLRLKSG